jgi:2-(1,2-epoxy-1,2-dihydrophenyl)acetyl-CoA isomerase
MALVDLEYEFVNDKKIAHLSLNNPTTKNSMTWEMGEEFVQKINEIKSSSEPPACVLLSGKNMVFSSGGDLGLLQSFKDKPYEKNVQDMYTFYNNFLSIRSLAMPTVAAVNGHAMGAAFSLSLACDFRIYSLSGKYSFNFVKLAIHPGMGSSFLARELFGKDKANYLLMLGETLNGEEARNMGICHDAVPLEDVKKRAMEIAITLTESSPFAIQLLKETYSTQEELQKALRREAEAQSKCFQTNDFLESIYAIQEKRKPVFLGK